MEWISIITWRVSVFDLLAFGNTSFICLLSAVTVTLTWFTHSFVVVDSSCQ